MRHRRAREAIDLDRALVVDAHACRFEPEPLHIGAPSGREHHLVDDDIVVVGQLDAQSVIDLLDRLDDALADHPDAAPLHLGSQMGADIVVEPAQDVLAAIDQRDLRAEPGEDAGELDRDIAAALDQDALRQLGQMKRFVRRNDMLDPGDARAHAGPAAGRDQDVFGANAPVIREQPHGVRILEHRARFDDRHVRAREVRRIGGLEPRNLLVLVGDQGRPVERGALDGPAETGRLLELVGRSARRRPAASSARSRGSRRCRRRGTPRRA